jgi:hypothetical protein
MKRYAATTIMVVIALVMQTIAPPVTRASQQQQSKTVVPDGTELVVVTIDDISSRDATEGDPVNFRVVEDVLIDGRVVIAKGTLAKGTVTSAVRSGRMGKGGKLGIRLESTTTVDRQQIKLRAAKGKKGDDNTASVIALTMLVSVFFLLKKGNDAKIKAGTRIEVFTDEEKLVGAPTPLSIAEQRATEAEAQPKAKKKDKPWYEMSKP